MPPHAANTLYYGDNLSVLREHIAPASVDLVYLDPPFNSNRNYNVLFKDEHGKDADAQIHAFEDTWRWNEAAEQTYHELIGDGPPHVGQLVGSLRGFLGANQMLAYLVMMAARLVELHRVLKPTGSLYLHCDPTASHYLKIILDTIFGTVRYQNELIWKRSAAHGGPSSYNNIHDVILYYAKTERPTWNAPRVPYDASYIESHYGNIDTNGRRYQLVSAHGAGDGPPRWFGERLIAPPAGRHWMSQEHIEQMMAEGRVVFTKSGMPRYKRYLEDTDGVPLGTVWDDIPPVNSQARERLGYPTQKPLALLERIIQSSTNPGDIVLDPFCGCGTAVAAAQKLGRRWIGIDVTHLAIALQKSRMLEMFPGIQFQVIGEPEDIGSARKLAKDDPFQFQWWALSLIKARPLGGEGKVGKKGADRGVDGIIPFIDDPSETPKRALVQVKSGKVKSSDVRDLRGTMEREGAPLGAFLTLNAPTRDMLSEAAAAGFYRSPGWQRDYPRLQVLTIADLLAHKAELKMPPAYAPWKLAQRTGAMAEQHRLEW